MQVVHERCCGLDVHKKTVVACILITLANGEVQRHIRTFSPLRLVCWRFLLGWRAWLLR
jgi:transposase